MPHACYGRNGHTVFNLEAVGAGFGDLEGLVDGQLKGVATVGKLRVPAAAGVFQFELVGSAAIRRFVGGKHGEHHREVVVEISLGKANVEAQVVGCGFLDFNSVADIVEALPSVGVEGAFYQG